MEEEIICRHHKKLIVNSTNIWKSTFYHTDKKEKKKAYIRKLRPETIKLLEENIGKTLSDINYSRILSDPPPKILEIKAKINTWDLIKIKSFCTTKENIRFLTLPSWSTSHCVSLQNAYENSKMWVDQHFMKWIKFLLMPWAGYHMQWRDRQEEGAVVSRLVVCWLVNSWVVPVRIYKAKYNSNVWWSCYTPLLITLLRVGSDSFRATIV